MAVLSRTPGDVLASVWAAAGLACEVTVVRMPEVGQVTVRGRIGGGGQPFNVGEATVTRATVRLGSGEVGHSYALGSDREKARLAATIDALWQRPDARERVREAILAPLGQRIDEADHGRRAETAATRVNFFTMVRGED